MGQNKIRRYYEKKLFKLFKKYLSGKAKSNEQEFVGSYDTWFDSKNGLYENLPVEEQELLTKKMLEQVHERMGEKTVISIRYHTLRKLSAVAAVLLLLASIWLWKQYYTNRKQVLLTQADRFKNDVAPGYNGAVLTLSNGHKIMLDSSADVVSIYDNKTRIVKQNGSIFYKGLSGANLYNTVTTPVGRQWKLTLPDGTKAWLNAASSIRYPLAFNTDKRMVIMTGEVYFEVKHNAKQPLLVTVNGQVIEDIGTAFDVKAYDDEKQVKTTLVEGRVKISSGTNNPPIVLHPGQQADLDINGSLKVVNNVDLENILAWKDGITSFKDADIQTIMREVARWYNVKVVYEGEIPDRLFTGEIMRTSNLSDLLKILEESNIRFKIDGNTITVMQ